MDIVRVRSRRQPEVFDARDASGRLIAAFVLSVTCCVSWSCEVATSVTVREGPTFELSGKGRLRRFTVNAPATGRRIGFAGAGMGTVIWEIVASPRHPDGSPVGGMRLTYGQVPDGYEQTVPVPSRHPDPLPVNVVSSFFAETLNAPGVGGFIFMRPTGPVQIEVRDHCMRSINGHEVEVNCETDEPYQEPVDLERFVQEHRVRR